MDGDLHANDVGGRALHVAAALVYDTKRAVRQAQGGLGGRPANTPKGAPWIVGLGWSAAAELRRVTPKVSRRSSQVTRHM